MNFVSLNTTRWKDGKWVDFEQTIPVDDIKSIEPYNKSPEQKVSPRHADVEMSKVYLKSNKPSDPYAAQWNPQKDQEGKALFLIALRKKEELDTLLGAIRT